jgi:hypothetical protein
MAACCLLAMYSERVPSWTYKNAISLVVVAAILTKL